MAHTLTEDQSMTWNEKFTKVIIGIENEASLAATLAPGVPFQLLEVRAKFSASTAVNLTITLDANAGAAYDAVLYTADFSAGVTSWAYRFDAEELMTFGPGDEIDFAWADAAKTVGLQVVYRVPYSS